MPLAACSTVILLEQEINMEIARMAIKDNTIALMIKRVFTVKNKKVNPSGVKFRSSEVLGFGN